MKKSKIFFLTILLCVSSWLGISVEAEEKAQSNGGYNIEGVANERQIDPNVSYFYLHELPGATDQLQVKLINQTDSEKILQVKVTNGNTNSNGLIDYTGKLKDHQTLKTPLTSLLKPQEEKVKVPANSEVIATLDLKMPEEEQDGIILGGIVVSDLTEKEKEEAKLSVGNTYSYTLGVVLANKADAAMSVSEGIDLVLERVEAKLVSGKKIVQADILNPNPYILEKSTVEGKIIQENGDKVVQERKAENVRMAPYSAYPFQFDWKKEELKPGNYIFKGKVTSEKKNWEFTQKFTVSEEETQAINKKSVFKIQIPSWLIWSLWLFVMVSIISTLFILFRGGK
ncbi:hypothetical protein A5844_002183 [Enterococcus sp. 10A9_DIV0425]|uniref:Uncharacterized protein n=1 Tax=Candidatus Enterococcus wittei TaxID=1987383 RepID=A0A242K0K0_9ENTE|nr:DUF916 and DUF3324 domain-containing protein [Enterococcus sp. 10A9_DIV0425]OTP10483.1 hypothetical protein A5844_002183 [Enterococcus sp. 10A9_DIV0425]THE12896.1 DUF916 and DUF3324 domain-containing protein [Enterococcus hirae]